MVPRLVPMCTDRCRLVHLQYLPKFRKPLVCMKSIKGSLSITRLYALSMLLASMLHIFLLLVELLHEVLVGSSASVQQNGWMDSEIFVRFLKHFKAHTNRTRGITFARTHITYPSLPFITYRRLFFLPFKDLW